MGEDGMTSVEEALEIVLNVAQRLPPVSVPLHEALCKVLAQDITDPHPLRPYPSSVKDGYAVVASDGPGECPVITESRAGKDGVGETVIPGTVAYMTTGGECICVKYLYVILKLFPRHPVYLDTSSVHSWKVGFCK
ncbi:Molybdopterin biosynthesis protein CNX1 [Abeliophyllum distichum]|uniref:Molybdopterin biosynthesis protein CNX1 n=1 Tax=Abeliophyllum distichum TaxID=126358 RepID=A0ABD1U1E7_9LAMI